MFPRRSIGIRLLLGILLLTTVPAYAWQEGLSATSVGRFGWWPYNPYGDVSHYEENLVARVWPDHLERTVADALWSLEFGAGALNPGAIDTVEVETLNWISKRVRVLRGATEYRLSVNCVSPGIRLEAAENQIYVASTDSLGFLAYAGENGITVVDFDDPPGGGPAYDADRDGPWTENWLLVWYAGDSPLERQVPLLLSLSRQPETVYGSSEDVRAQFLMAPGDSIRSVLSMPYGVGSLDPAEVAGWSPTLPDSVANRCRLFSELSVHWPAGVTEMFEIDEVARRVQVQDQFVYRDLDDQWGTEADLYAPIPPLVSFARDHGHDVETPDPGLTAIGYPTKYGDLEVVLGTDISNYTLPLPPEHNVHLVSGGTEGDWRELAAGCISHFTNTLVWDLNDSYGGGAWTLAGMKGSFTALLAVDPTTRGRFLFKAREILDNVTLDFGAGTSPYNEITEPTTGRSFHYLIWNKNPGYPWDGDASAGANLAFIWEYGLHSGDWDYLAGKWTEIQNIFEYLHLVNDWAYLASSCRHWGSGGSFLDMFAAQWMGYLAYSQIARTLGHDEAYREGLYLAARSLIPLTARFQFEPYVTQYFPFEEEEQIVSGFGECEPSGVLNNVWCGQPHRSLIGWDDKTIAGERFHPLVYDLYMRYVPAEFEAILLEGEALNGADYNFENGSYVENHIYAFTKIGRSRDWVEEKWAQAHTAEPVGGDREELFGPSIGGWVAFMMSLIGGFDIPVRVGSWAPAVVEFAHFTRETGELHLKLHNDHGDPAELKLLSATEPLWASVDGAPVGWTYDPMWEVASVTIEGAGTHQVVVGYPFTGTNPYPAQPDSNLVFNGGFEDCGYENPNYLRPWGQWADTCSWAEVAHVGMPNDSVHSGEMALKLRSFYCDSTDISIHQDVYFGEGNTYTVRLWYNIPNEIPENSLRFILQEIQDRHDADSGSLTFFPPADQNPSDGWQELVAEVSDHAIEGAAICRIGIRLTDAIGATVFIDDVSLVCPALSDVEEPVDPGVEQPRPLRFTADPNPFIEELQMRWTGGGRQRAELTVYDLQGRLVCRRRGEAGVKQIVWDGKDGRGHDVASGLYLVHLRAGERSRVKKVMRLR